MELLCVLPIVMGMMLLLAQISNAMHQISENISLIRYELEHWHDTDTEDES